MRPELAYKCALPEVGRLSADLTTQLNSGTLDQQSVKAEGLMADVVWEATTAAGATGDEIDFTVDIDDSADGTNWTTQKTYARSVVVDDNNFEHVGSMRVPLPSLNSLRRYVRASVTLAAGTGAPTISASAGSINLIPTDLREAPEAGYDVDGYGVETIGTA